MKFCPSCAKYVSNRDACGNSCEYNDICLRTTGDERVSATEYQQIFTLLYLVLMRFPVYCRAAWCLCVPLLELLSCPLERDNAMSSYLVFLNVSARS